MAKGNIGTYAASFNVRDVREQLSTDAREPRTATGSRMFPSLAWFCSLPRTGKALVDNCGLTLQPRWRENAPKKEKFNFRLPCGVQKTSMLSTGDAPHFKCTVINQVYFTVLLFNYFFYLVFKKDVLFMLGTKTKKNTFLSFIVCRS